MKIDLHCHTKKTKIGDPETREVSPEFFAKKIRDAGVDIVAITNHNLFDIEQFRLLEHAVLEECKLWPGVEFDVVCKKGNAHILVICNPLHIDLFSKTVLDFTSGHSPDEFKTEIKKIIEVFEPIDVIFIPHHFKEPGINDEDVAEIKHYLKEPSRLFLESTYRSVGILANFKEHIIAGSDVKNWELYDKHLLPELRLPIETFSQFCLLAKKDEQVIKTLLDKKKSVKVLASPHENVNIELNLYHDINIFFGQKGTGKTKILESLVKMFESQGKICSTYYSYKRESDFSASKQVDFDGNSCNALGVNDCRAEFEAINKWLETSPTEIQNYFDSIESATTKKTRLELRLADADHIEIPKLDKKIRDDLIKTNEILGFLKKIFSRQYITQDIAKRIEFDISSLYDAILLKYRSNWIEENSAKLTNSMIDSIRIHADQCTGSKSRPTNTGLLDFYENRLDLYQNFTPIHHSLFHVPENTEFELMGEIEGKGSLYSRIRHRFFCKQSEGREFPNTYNVIKKITKCIDVIYKNPFKIDTASMILQLKSDFIQRNIVDLSSFIGISLDYVLDKQQIYTPSTGEKGMILLEKVLAENSDVYILDGLATLNCTEKIR